MLKHTNQPTLLTTITQQSNQHQINKSPNVNNRQTTNNKTNNTPN